MFFFVLKSKFHDLSVCLLVLSCWADWQQNGITANDSTITETCPTYLWHRQQQRRRQQQQLQHQQQRLLLSSLAQTGWACRGEWSSFLRYLERKQIFFDRWKNDSYKGFGIKSSFLDSYFLLLRRPNTINTFDG